MNRIIRLLAILLFPIFPILFVYFRNEYFIFEGGLYIPILIVISAVLVLYFILNLINHKNTNNVLIVLIIAWWFLLYGHIYFFILDYFNLKYTSFRHRFFLPVYSILFFIPVWLIYKAKRVSDNLILILFIVGIALNIQFSTRIINLIFNKNIVKKDNKINDLQKEMPDVYYIILDSYPNINNLKTYYHFDNSIFINQLKQLGFSVSDSARSNYPFTYFSLSSSLNMEYINYYEDTISYEKKNEDYPFKRIRHNKVAKYFKSKGYKYVIFPSGYEALNDLSESDVAIKFDLKINSFYETLIKYSALNCLNLNFYGHGIYDLVKTNLSLLPNTPRIKRSKFVFFHCYPPHPPCVFDENGNYINSSVNVENGFRHYKEYINQIKFVNNEIIKSVKKIIATSDIPPIIIIQGDHGTASSERFEDELKWEKVPSKELLIERFGILNAMYFPEKYKIKFPPNHTPVNTFRIILNKLFNDTLQILPSKSYYARYRKNFNFKEIDWNTKTLK